ncbi:hypothetical protein S245_015663, partial [Arachis hypogaea]
GPVRTPPHPFNKCRQAEFYLPWKCENERHSYEKCQYELLMEHMFRCKRSRNEPPLITLNPRASPFPSSLKLPMPDSFQAVAGLAADGRQIVARTKSEATNYD